MDEHKRAVHALNRLTFGPRPGDLQRVEQMGVQKWVDLQLHPERIDDSALETRLVPFRTLRMDTRELVENFPPNQVIRQVANGKTDLPSDPTKRAVYEAQVRRYEERQERKEDASKNPSTADPAIASADSEKGMADDADREGRQEDRRVANPKVKELLDLPPDQRLKEILQMPAEN